MWGSGLVPSEMWEGCRSQTVDEGSQTPSSGWARNSISWHPSTCDWQPMRWSTSSSLQSKTRGNDTLKQIILLFRSRGNKWTSFIIKLPLTHHTHWLTDSSIQMFRHFLVSYPHQTSTQIKALDNQSFRKILKKKHFSVGFKLVAAFLNCTWSISMAGQISCFCFDSKLLVGSEIPKHLYLKLCSISFMWLLYIVMC